ncbi:hypothetical protein EC973_003180 [Apophysomyces ossiformis]|uniref:Flavin-containing monooxygenase n=1 Tax=Apophysomyces ossiformis TaxID=679940 RepID=A0A8H7BI67_9FUNG|nr:hypothetical protein EC973_003180 [Apophysomyces ossiformis]
MVNTSFNNQIIKRVAIIGAGPSGLSAAKVMRDEGTFEKVIVFERNCRIGGTWIYSSDVNPNPPIPSVDVLKVDPPGNATRVLSPMYDGLHTNLPHPVMAYRDFPFADDTPLFPSHHYVLEYLELFTKHFQLEPMIRFDSNVTNLQHDAEGWKLSVKDKNSDYMEEFDAVIVATGHYSVPRIPDINGLTTTKARILHSREYRNPEAFRDQTICVIGAGSSALDIVRETANTARQIYHSVRTDNERSAKASERSPDNVTRIGQINFVHQHQIESDDGIFNVDTIIFATGYLYSFPFLPFQRTKLLVDGQVKMQNLYRDIFYINDPTLAFVGLPMRTVPFPLAQIQSTAIARCWNRKTALPSITEMHRENREDPLAINSDPLTFVLPREKEVRYMNTLSAWAEGVDGGKSWQASNVITEPIPEWWHEMRLNAMQLRKEHLGY